MRTRTWTMPPVRSSPELVLGGSSHRSQSATSPPSRSVATISELAIMFDAMNARCCEITRIVASCGRGRAVGAGRAAVAGGRVLVGRHERHALVRAALTAA